MAEFRGIDVSSHNGVIDWARVKASGQVDFAIIRSSYGYSESLEEYTDSQFKANIKGCEENGIPYGLYHYSYCTDPKKAEREAKYFLEIINETNPTYPIFISVGNDGHQSISWRDNTSIVATFKYVCERWEYLAGFYTTKEFADKHLNMNALRSTDQWISDVGDTNTFGDCDIWQCDVGRVDGIEGDVCLNICYQDYPALIRVRNLNQKRYHQDEDVAIIKNPDLVDRDDIEWVRDTDIKIKEVDNKTASGVSLIVAETPMTITTEMEERKRRDNYIEWMRSRGYITAEEAAERDKKQMEEILANRNNS